MTEHDPQKAATGFIPAPAHGGYEDLLPHQRAVIVYDGTVRFCGRFRDAPELTDTGELRAWIGKMLLWVNQKLLLKDADRRRGKHLEPVSGETISCLE